MKFQRQKKIFLHQDPKWLKNHKHFSCCFNQFLVRLFWIFNQIADKMINQIENHALNWEDFDIMVALKREPNWFFSFISYWMKFFVYKLPFKNKGGIWLIIISSILKTRNFCPIKLIWNKLKKFTGCILIKITFIYFLNFYSLIFFLHKINKIKPKKN